MARFRRRRTARRLGPLRRLALVLGLLAALAAGLGAARHHPLVTGVAVPYDRALYPHWLDADGDCLDARAERLLALSAVPVTLDPTGCRAVAGRWHDAYAGGWLEEAAAIDLDHLVPLAEAHRSGAWAWPADRRAAFANDPDNLVVTAAAVNRSKGGRDPVDWLPPTWGLRCPYLERWRRVKAAWQLAEDPVERLVVDAGLALCARLAPAPG